MWNSVFQTVQLCAVFLPVNNQIELSWACCAGFPSLVILPLVWWVWVQGYLCPQLSVYWSQKPSSFWSLTFGRFSHVSPVEREKRCTITTHHKTYYVSTCFGNTCHHMRFVPFYYTSCHFVSITFPKFSFWKTQKARQPWFLWLPKNSFLHNINDTSNVLNVASNYFKPPNL